VLTSFDQLFCVGLSRVWRTWRGPLFYVQAETVVRWQRDSISTSHTTAASIFLWTSMPAIL
jgi:hypothetical protein